MDKKNYQSKEQLSESTLEKTVGGAEVIDDDNYTVKECRYCHETFDARLKICPHCRRINL